MILELRNIEKSFGEKKVLTGVSFKAEGGKAFGLLGRNGAGKTTSIRILMDVFPANSGEVLIDGQPIDYNKIGIGYLPEERGLYPKKIIIDQLTYFAELKGMSRKAAVESIDYWLDRLGMAEYRNKRLDTLSTQIFAWNLCSLGIGLCSAYHCRCRQIRQYVDFLSVLRFYNRPCG